MAPTDDELWQDWLAALGVAGASLPPGGLQPDHRLDRDLGLDSLQLLKAARHLEARHGYAFAVADWVAEREEGEGPQEATVASLLAWVQKQLHDT